MILRWEQPAPPVALAWLGPDQRVRAAAAYQPPRPIAAIVGPPGPSGNEANRYTHVQTNASPEWIVNHNLGMQPGAVSIKSVGGVEVEAEIVNISINQLRIYFSTPFAGTAVVI